MCRRVSRIRCSADGAPNDAAAGPLTITMAQVCRCELAELPRFGQSVAGLFDFNASGIALEQVVEATTIATTVRQW